MRVLTRPLVLVHGLWDKPSLFRELLERLPNEDKNIFVPNLPHKLGKTSLVELASELDKQINLNLGSTSAIDILGFSMGGLVTRIWLQEFGGISRTKRFFTVGTPHSGTLTAQLIPAFLLKGISEMKIGSHLISRLNNEIEILQKIECISFYTKWDLMTFPGWRAKLPCGKSIPLPVLSHKELMFHPKAIKVLVSSLLS